MYKIIGADQKEYGPVSTDQLRQWIAEGRINAHTPVQAEGETTWKPVSTVPEFAASFPGAPAPFAAPPPLGGSPAAVGGDGHPRAKQDVIGPAVGLMVTAGLGILYTLLDIAWILLGNNTARMDALYRDLDRTYGQNAEVIRGMQMAMGPVGIIIRAAGILVCILILYGAVKMKNLENYGLAITVSILAMIPCLSPCLSPCCVIGLPMGIWALVILNKTEIKSSFR